MSGASTRSTPSSAAATIASHSSCTQCGGTGDARSNSRRSIITVAPVTTFRFNQELEGPAGMDEVPPLGGHLQRVEQQAERLALTTNERRIRVDQQEGRAVGKGVGLAREPVRMPEVVLIGQRDEREGRGSDGALEVRGDSGRRVVAQHPEGRPLRGDLIEGALHRVEGAIGRPVVRDHQLGRGHALREDAPHLLADEPFAVEGRHRDRDPGRGAGSGPELTRTPGWSRGISSVSAWPARPPSARRGSARPRDRTCP